MDLVICEAPLDNSFQKEKLELVNKGSLGRRRKPSRSNLKLLLSPSTFTSQPILSTCTSQPAPTNSISEHLSKRTISNSKPTRIALVTTTPKPTSDAPKLLVNGFKERNAPRHYNKGLKIEQSLPRIPAEPNHYVNDAQQFTIEAKLKRRKSDSGRSAVLIQTWERRTRCDSFSRQSKPTTVTARTNRFQNKENLGHSVAMPDSHVVCAKYSGNFKNNQWSKEGGFVASVRDDYSREKMLYQMPQNGVNYKTVSKMQQTNHKVSMVEPEWISLSRKLRAKFVEGHIEHNSADSYLHEEPEGVKLVIKKQLSNSHQNSNGHAVQQPSPVQQSLEKQRVQQPQKTQLNHQPNKTQSLQQPQKAQTTQQPPKKQPIQLSHKIEKKAKVIVDTREPRTQTEEPPWVQLSRKLCTKFIEEHIEYPVVNDEVPTQKISEVLERNGDVRIIEKVGKPKQRKSKTRKETEPEWVSLSRKLRAKFIESHIDDPDTISLDNQLNASDPEETSSESLSDSLPEITPSKGTSNIPKISQSTREMKLTNHTDHQEIYSKYKKPNGMIFPEKESCWEYQEMEFDTESNSGTFQETDVYEENTPRNVPQEKTTVNSEYDYKNNDRQFDVDVYTNNMSFVETINCEPFHNAECYNNDVRFPPRNSGAKDIAYRSPASENDVRFAPRISSNEEMSYSNSASENKFITVQFVAHPEVNLSNCVDSKNNSPRSSPLRSPTKNSNCDFFNISTWEEAHYKSDDADSECYTSPCQETGLTKSFRSKSMDDICETTEEDCFESQPEMSRKEQRKVTKLYVPLSKSGPLSKSETVLCQLEGNSNTQNVFRDINDSPMFNPDCKPSTTLKSSFSQETSDKNVRKKSEDRQCLNSSEKIDNGPLTHNIKQEKRSTDFKKQFKCNGVIPNTRKDLPANKSNEIPNQSAYSETVSQSKRLHYNETASRNEYANVNPLADKADSFQEDLNHSGKLKNKSKSMQHIFEKVSDGRTEPTGHLNGRCDYTSVTKNSLEVNTILPELTNGELNTDDNETDTRGEGLHLKTKSKSMCDISESEVVDAAIRIPHEKIDTDQIHNGKSQYAVVKSKGSSNLQFQHFESESDIPLCAKLVSKQNGKSSISSISSSSNRNVSPCSETSHVYEDMFKETTSCPSDSETSSWTVLKKNSYYINGRSSSMNDLDYSDSCSLSVKCDYASSCSEHSTLHSRQSSCTSSSFYVNLRDYDSHMLEPSLNRRKEANKRMGNGNSSTAINSNPPTPESLRHLFTSPFNSTPHRANRLLNKLPSEPEIHYYSTVSAASSAFKHGFDPSPPKPKKAERSSSIKIKDIAHGIILTFRKFQNHSKNSQVSSTHYVDVSHLAESGTKANSSNKSKSKKDLKEDLKKQERKGLWGFPFDNGKTDSDSGCQLSASEMQKAKARRSSSDLSGKKPYLQTLNKKTSISEDVITPEKKKSKSGKKNSNAREKAKKTRSKSMETKTIPTVSRKIQQMADGTLCLVTTVSGDTTLPGVYSDSPDTSSELSTHRPVKPSGESNC